MALLDYTGLSYFLDKLNLKFAPLASPALTGTPTAPTPSAGDDSTKIATTAFVQDAVAGGGGSGAYLPLSGGELSGQLDISQSLINGTEVPFINASASNLTLGTNPSGSQYWGLYFTDSSKSTGMDGRIGSVESTVSAAGTAQVSLSAYRYIANKTGWESGNIRVSVASDGTVTTYAPTPPADSDSTQIATTAWVNTKVGDYLPLTGGAVTSGNWVWRNNSTTYLRISGGSAANTAGNIVLRGEDATINPGGVEINAYDGTTAKQLLLKPDGTFTWGGTDISLSGHTHAYLPTAGGTMTGVINRNGTLAQSNSTTGSISIQNGTAASGGGGIWMYGASHSSNPGVVRLQSYNSSTSKYYALDVKNDASLTWSGDTFGFTTVAGTIKVASGASRLGFHTGDNNFDGSSLQMFGRSHSSYAGRFYLRASTKTSSSDTTGTSYDLTGYPDGSLTWSGSSFKVNGIEVSLSGHTHSYLPLSGGTMTGAITRNGDAIVNSVDTSWVRINGGTSNSNGANAYFRGKSATTGTAGEFVINANDGTTTKTLNGKPDGTLTWGGTFTANSTITGSGLRATSAYIGFDGSFGRAYMDAYDSPKYLRITGGSSTTSGAYLDLQNSTNGNGTFSLVTRVSSTNTSLVGNGTTLTWGGTMKATSFQATSDIRKKHNKEVVQIDLSNLNAYRYTFEPDGEKHIGLIAQEVEKIIPEAVDTDEEGFKTLDYNSIVALLVSEINSLKKRVKDLEDGKRV